MAPSGPQEVTPSMADYQPMDGASSRPGLARRAAAVSFGLAAAGGLLVLSACSGSLNGLGGASPALLLASEGSPSSYACSCPPSEAIWRCTRGQYLAVRNGSACAYYRPSGGACASCAGDAAASPACRACALGMNQHAFCGACVRKGLNDVGCRGCPPKPAGAPRMGGDADAHGCRASAGYQWCGAKRSCIRSWEEGIATQAAFNERCVPEPRGLVGGDADGHGCLPSAGYAWCEGMGACVRPWEQGLASESAFAARCAPSGDEHGCIPSAGYRWCRAMGECVRPWEHGLASEDAFAAKCAALRHEALGSDRDEHGCIPSAGYSWCESTKECVRPWEHRLQSREAFDAFCEVKQV